MSSPTQCLGGYHLAARVIDEGDPVRRSWPLQRPADGGRCGLESGPSGLRCANGRSVDNRVEHVSYSEPFEVVGETISGVGQQDHRVLLSDLSQQLEHVRSQRHRQIRPLPERLRCSFPSECSQVILSTRVGPMVPVRSGPSAIHDGPVGSQDSDGVRRGTLSDRAALEQILGHPVTGGPWPAGSLPLGATVRVLQDPEWGGPWARVFSGVIDDTAPPVLVANPKGDAGEFSYFVRFNEPQFDRDGDGRYRKAQILGRYPRREDA